MDAVYEVTCAKDNDQDGHGDEGIDGHLLDSGVCHYAVKGGRTAVGAAVNVALTYYGQVFECEDAQKHNLDADLQEEVEEIQV